MCAAFWADTAMSKGGQNLFAEINSKKARRSRSLIFRNEKNSIFELLKTRFCSEAKKLGIKIGNVNLVAYFNAAPNVIIMLQSVIKDMVAGKIID